MNKTNIQKEKAVFSRIPNNYGVELTPINLNISLTFEEVIEIANKMVFEMTGEKVHTVLEYSETSPYILGLALELESLDKLYTKGIITEVDFEDSYDFSNFFMIELFGKTVRNEVHPTYDTASGKTEPNVVFVLNEEEYSNCLAKETF